MGYFGSKAGAGVYQTIISLIPPHDTYIETHLGSGAILLKKPAAPHNIGIDRDPTVITAFQQTWDNAQLPGDIALIAGCAKAYLSTFPFTGREFIYADPPYLLTTRTSNHRYPYEYSVQQHRELLDLLKTVPCPVLISGYPSALYDEVLPDWQTKTFQAMTRGGVRTEQVWFNYTPDRLHWAAYAGTNFTDRQRIKRKAQRWANNYAALPAGERLAVLAAIMAAEGETE